MRELRKWIAKKKKKTPEIFSPAFRSAEFNSFLEHDLEVNNKAVVADRVEDTGGTRRFVRQVDDVVVGLDFCVVVAEVVIRAECPDFRIENVGLAGPNEVGGL